MTHYIVTIDTYYHVFEVNVLATDEYNAIDIACNELELEEDDIYLVWGTPC